MENTREKTEFVDVQETGPVDRELLARLETHRKSDEKWRRAAHILAFTYQFMSTVLAGFILGALAYSLAVYFQTRNRLLANGQSPWPNPAVLWPTYLLLAVSILTFVTNVLLLLVPCFHKAGRNSDIQANSRNIRSVKAARQRTGRLLNSSQYVTTAIYFVAWAVSSGLFQMANTGQDLWGWSCSPQSDAIQPQVQSYLNFGQLCLLQGGSWDAMCLHAAVWALAGATYIMVLWRWRRRRTLRSMEAELERSTSVIERA